MSNNVEAYLQRAERGSDEVWFVLVTVPEGGVGDVIAECADKASANRIVNALNYMQHHLTDHTYH